MRLHIGISKISPALLAAVLSGSGALRAAPEDTLQAYASASVTHDNNLLRLSGDIDPVTVSGQPSVADTIKQGTLGMKVDWRQGMQAVVLDASVNESRFSRFTLLNNQATNVQARWNWQLASSLSGDVGYNRNTSLASFAEQHNLARNLSTQQNAFADGAWQVLPGMRLNGSLSRSHYNAASNSVYGNEFTSYAVGAYYTPPSGNEIGIRGVRQVQEYPVLQAFSGVPVDNGFTQDQLLATVNWLYSGHIRINGQAGAVNRAHRQLAARDFSGKTMRGTLTWLASGKGQVDLSAWNEIDAYDNLTTSYTRSKGVSLGPGWSLTGKLSVAARLQHVQRDFLGDPGLLLSAQPTRRDITDSASLSASYQPVRAVNVSASIQSERRRSNQALVDYADKTISLNMSVMF